MHFLDNMMFLMRLGIMFNNLNNYYHFIHFIRHYEGWKIDIIDC